MTDTERYEAAIAALNAYELIYNASEADLDRDGFNKVDVKPPYVGLKAAREDYRVARAKLYGTNEERTND
jgi:hypothetical protein